MVLRIHFNAGYCDEGNGAGSVLKPVSGATLRRIFTAMPAKGKECGEEYNPHPLPSSLVKSSCSLCPCRRYNGPARPREASQCVKIQGKIAHTREPVFLAKFSNGLARWFWEYATASLPSVGSSSVLTASCVSQDCMYLHVLALGFGLKSQKKSLNGTAKVNKISLEGLLEVEVRPFSLIRSIDTSLYPPLTQPSFLLCPALSSPTNLVQI
jgi:hypothetical protein